VLAVVAAYFLFRDDSAQAVRDCMEKAGASVRENPQFARLFPYLVAVAGTERVKSYPELDGATVYGVRYGTGEALLFVGHDDGAARAFERTLVRYAARGGRSTPARRKGRVLLIWTVPMESPSASTAIDGCVG
jgi:hypothetical protein